MNTEVLRTLALLIILGRVDAVEPNARPINFNCIAINCRCAASKHFPVGLLTGCGRFLDLPSNALAQAAGFRFDLNGGLWIW